MYQWSYNISNDTKRFSRNITKLSNKCFSRSNTHLFLHFTKWPTHLSKIFRYIIFHAKDDYDTRFMDATKMDCTRNYTSFFSLSTTLQHVFTISYRLTNWGMKKRKTDMNLKRKPKQQTLEVHSSNIVGLRYRPAACGHIYAYIFTRILILLSYNWY